MIQGIIIAGRYESPDPLPSLHAGDVMCHDGVHAGIRALMKCDPDTHITDLFGRDSRAVLFEVPRTKLVDPTGLVYPG